MENSQKKDERMSFYIFGYKVIAIAMSFIFFATANPSKGLLDFIILLMFAGIKGILWPIFILLALFN